MTGSPDRHQTAGRAGTHPGARGRGHGAVGAVTGLFVCNGPVLGFTFGVFLKPIMADTGWQRSTASFALSFGGILSALAVPVLG